MEFDPTGIFGVAAIIAVIFGIVASRTGQGIWLGALLGGLMGLTVCTITVGLAHAVALPYMNSVVASKYILGAVIAILISVALAAAMIFRARWR